MSIVESLLLGILQGATEFLPVSSSGHLLIVGKLFGLENMPLLFSVFLHMATLFSVLVFFRKQIIELIAVFFRWIFRRPIPHIGEESSLLDKAQRHAEEISKRKMIVALIFATFITGVMGLLLSDIVGNLPVQFVFIGFLVTAVMLCISQKVASVMSKHNLSKPEIHPLKGVIIGFVQGIGIFPGISRSGITISGAILCGVDRNVAGEFSFLLSIPAILAAFLLELRHVDELTSGIGILPLAIGCLAAFVSGLLALAWFMKLIRKGNLGYFAFYLIPLGIAGLLFF